MPPDCVGTGTQDSVNHLNGFGHPYVRTTCTYTYTLPYTHPHSDCNHGFRCSCGANGLVGGEEKADSRREGTPPCGGTLPVLWWCWSRGLRLSERLSLSTPRHQGCTGSIQPRSRYRRYCRKCRPFKLKALLRLDSTSVEQEQPPSTVLQVSQMSLRSVSMELKEEELEGNHLVISCTINKNSPNNVPTHTLIDCSATGYAFIDNEFVHYHSLLRYCLKTEKELEVIDGRLIKSRNITHMTKISLFINGHEERLPAFITHLGHYPLVLGKP